MKRNKNTDYSNITLEDGDVIVFSLPIFNSAGDTIAGIETDPGIRHYAVVIGKSGLICDDFLKRDALGEPDIGNNPCAPSISIDSFRKNKSNSDEIMNIYSSFRNYRKIKNYDPYKRPRECAVCSVYDDINLQYTWVGRLKNDVCRDIAKYCRAAKNIPHYLLSQKDDNSYYLTDPRSGKSDNAELQKTAEISLVCCDNKKIAHTNLLKYRLLILPLYCYEQASDVFFIEDMPWQVKKVVPQDDYTLLLRFEDGKEGVFDMWPLIKQEDGGDDAFVKLEDIDLFMTAHLEQETVGWDGETTAVDSEVINDICVQLVRDTSIAPETLYDFCVSVEEYKAWRAKRKIKRGRGK